MNTRERFQTAVMTLLDKEPYFAQFLLNSTVVWNMKGVDTAGAAVIGGKTTLIFSDKFFEDKTTDFMRKVIKHEILHLLLYHAENYSKSKNRLAANIAQDCVINQHIGGFEKPYVTLEGLSEQLGVRLAPNETTDYYLDKILRYMEKQGNSGLDGMETVDEHEVEGADEGRIAEAAVKGTAKKAAKAAAGNVPSYVLDVLQEKDAELNWKMLLRNFVATATARTTKATKKRLNRRFELPVPGRKKERKLRLGVCMDSSGSVSNEAYAAFLGELVAIAKLGTDIVVIDADCEVQDVYEVSSAKDVKRVRSGSGGTAYQPAINRAIEEKCTAIVYFGDMDSADQPKDPGVPFLWVIVGDQEPPARFGRSVRLTGV